jgi:hypothetical protein
LKLLLVTTVLLGAWAQAGTSPSVQDCVAASGAGQEHQKHSALFSARKEFEICSASSCPQLVSTDCTRWLEEVITSMPSINIVARLNGVDQSAVVRLDGAPWLDRLTGRPVDIEPGEHDVEVEAGGVKLTQRLVVVQGEKNRVVVFALTGVATAPVTPVVTTPLTPGVRGFPTWPVVFSIGAVAGMTSFTILGLTGKGQLAKVVAQPCAATKSCDPAQTAAISRQFLAADISLGVGIASALAAGGFWWWWALQPHDAPTVALIPAGTSLQLLGSW